MDASPLWDRMVLMGRIQPSIHLTRSCMGSRTRMVVPTERVAPLVLWSTREGWECTTTKSSVLTSMMDMVEGDEDSGPPSVAGPEPGPPMPPFLSHLMPHMTLCCPSLSFIIHFHYRHLLISLHVNDCFTIPLAFGSPAPLIRSTPLAAHGLLSISIYALTFTVKTIASHSLLFSSSCPLTSIFLSFNTTSHLVSFLIVSTLSRCSLPLATARYCIYFIPAGTQGC